MKISFGISTHNEGQTIKNLIDNILNTNKKYDFEIIILDDYSTDEFTKTLLDMYSKYQDIKLYYNKLNENFASHKNLLNSYCNGDYIVNLDADENIDKFIIENIDEVINANTEIELFWMPRTNVVYGITDYHIRSWGWRVSAVDWLEQPVVNFPDYQGRIYKNLPSKIKWHGAVHEVITGAEKITYLPQTKEYCIIHEKPIFRQEQQNKFYSEINNG